MVNPRPKVSIVCITYNQEKYVRQTLDSFIMQKTNFPFEVVIHDDASTDKTRHIIEEYALKYPDIIKPVYEKENQYSGGDYKFINDTFQRAAGEYIAFCEGDDYWTDSDKLQIQVDYMESNPSVTVCFHPVEVFYENGEVEREIFPKATDASKFMVTDLLKKNFIQSNSVLYKRARGDYSKLPSKVIPSDWYMHLYHAQYGEVGFVDRVMSAYRRHSSGVWWDTHDNVDNIWRKYGRGHLELYRAVLAIYGDQDVHRDIITEKIREAFVNIIRANKGNARETSAILEDYSDLALAALGAPCAHKDLADAKVVIAEKNKKITAISGQLKELRESQSYKLGRIITSLPRKVKRIGQLTMLQYLPDESGLIRDDRSELIHALLRKFYEYKAKVSGIHVAVVASRASSSPTSSLFIRLVSPLTWGWTGKRVKLSLFEGDRTSLPPDVDVCIVQRTAFSDEDTADRFLIDLKKKNIKLVLDTDDLFSGLAPSHPQYALQASRVKALERISTRADRVWVSTDYIAKKYPGSVVHVNTQDPRLWRGSKSHGILAKNKKIRLLYMGTMTHGEDLGLILPAIEKLNRKHDGLISLTLIGVDGSLPQRDWITVLQPPQEKRVYPEFVTWLLAQREQYDIGLAPLTNSEFNKAKSDVKVLDYLGMGLLPIVSDLEPYRSPELDAFIVRVGYEKDAWVNALEDLIVNRKRYARKKRLSKELIETYLAETRSTKRAARLMLKELRRIKRAPGRMDRV